LTGATTRDIQEAIATTYPDVDAAVILTAAMDEIAVTGHTARASLVGFCLAASKELYRRMIEIGDFPGALRAVKQMHEIWQTDRGEGDSEPLSTGEIESLFGDRK
jgi:hypothetical protein